jgi:hypothetical protein
MRYLTADQVKALSLALGDARRSFDCQVPRLDATGAKNSPRGVAYGTHGAAFVQVDAESGAIRCGACAGEMDATVSPKRQVTIGRRTHLVSR